MGAELKASGGLAANLVSTIRSFLPMAHKPDLSLAAGKKPVKVSGRPSSCQTATSRRLLLPNLCAQESAQESVQEYHLAYVVAKYTHVVPGCAAMLTSVQ